MVHDLLRAELNRATKKITGIVVPTGYRLDGITNIHDVLLLDMQADGVESIGVCVFGMEIDMFT